VSANTDGGYTAALYERGVALHDRGELAAGEELWREAADAGHTAAQRNLDALAETGQPERESQ